MSNSRVVLVMIDGLGDETPGGFAAAPTVLKLMGLPPAAAMAAAPL